MGLPAEVAAMGAHGRLGPRHAVARPRHERVDHVAGVRTVSGVARRDVGRVPGIAPRVVEDDGDRPVGRRDVREPLVPVGFVQGDRTLVPGLRRWPSSGRRPCSDRSGAPRPRRRGRRSRRPPRPSCLKNLENVNPLRTRTDRHRSRRSRSHRRTGSSRTARSTRRRSGRRTRCRRRRPEQPDIGRRTRAEG